MKPRHAAGVVLTIALAAIASARVGEPRRAEANASVATRTPAEAAPRFEDVRAEIERRASEAEVLAEVSSESWGRQTSAATLNLQLAGLTGDWARYESADRFVGLATAAARARGATESRGPLLARAELDYALHRFAKVLVDLEPVTSDALRGGNDELLAQTKALEGATRVALGEYDRGQGLLREAATLDPERSSHRQRLAVALVKTGDFDEAVDIFARAEAAAPAGRGRAWLALQRGLVEMERGRFPVARAHLARASRELPGWWLVDEHLAELDAAEGRHAEAEAALRSLVPRTGDPEHMDALAELVRARGEEKEAAALEARARAVHEARLAKLPEAAAGHAVEHFLRVEHDPARTVALAEKNREVRPDGEASTHLAQAYLCAGRVADARKEIDLVLATRWSSGETFATAAVVFARAGDAARAASMRAAALARNPRAMSDVAWLDARAPLRSEVEHEGARR
ncbi:MAG: tetratricopeptide repeat protein [Deltaproteobacteria bacterium]|nr:tetratricopeptide repeat protein [Deltaproteobacteria bacterium]